MLMNERLEKVEYPLIGLWRNHFHLEVPWGLVNDPCGLSCVDGIYHIYFQWNPNGCIHKTKHWGIVKTKDFITYTKPKIFLAPDQAIDKDGVYTGCATYIDNIGYLFYTGNVRDENNIRIPHQNVAIVKNDKLIEKINIIKDSPQGYTDHYRDPFYYKGDKHYLLIGAKNTSLQGRIVLYSSKDLKKWNFDGEIETNYDSFGYMWECPNFFQLDGKDILAFCPQGLESQIYKFQNLHQSGYIVGKMDFKNRIMEHNDFQEFDYGFDFYAPQVLKEKNRVILQAWAGMPEHEEDYLTIQEGYVYSHTLPRELVLKEKHLYQKPIEEIYKLRNEKISVKDVVNKRCHELVATFEENQDVKLKIIFNDGYLLMEYDAINKTFILDRNHLSLGKKGIRRLKLEQLSNIDLFIDQNIIELYINDGQYVMTAIYYTKDETMKLEYDNSIKNIELWQLNSFNYKDESR